MCLCRILPFNCRTDSAISPAVLLWSDMACSIFSRWPYGKQFWGGPDWKRGTQMHYTLTKFLSNFTWKKGECRELSAVSMGFLCYKSCLHEQTFSKHALMGWWKMVRKSKFSGRSDCGLLHLHEHPQNGLFHLGYYTLLQFCFVLFVLLLARLLWRLRYIVL